MSLAWHVAALMRGKKLPKVNRLFAKPRTRPAQSWQEQLRVMDLWVAATRGRATNH